jgi:putative FmdB family regulatory protein
MPIYAYRCEACGNAQDVLQKMSDPVLTVCPACGAEAFKKQVTAAGFQLKGSGWYVTDFKGGSGSSAPPTAPVEGSPGAAAKAAAKADAPAPAPAAASPAPAPVASPAPAAANKPSSSGG